MCALDDHRYSEDFDFDFVGTCRPTVKGPCRAFDWLNPLYYREMHADVSE